MGAFTFTDPNGKSYTVNGPDGATQDQAFAMLQQQLKQRTDYGNPAESGTESYLDLGSMSIKQRPSDPFVAGVGKSFVDTGRGLKQLAMRAGNKLGLVSDQDLAANQQDIADSRSLDAPLMATTGGKVGQMVGQGAQIAAIPAEGLATNAVAGGAIAGAQPTVGNESHDANALLGAAGGAGGYVAGKALGAAIQPITDRLSSVGRQFRQILSQEGVPLDAAQATGSKIAQTLKNAGSDAPLSGHTEFPQQQAEQFTRATLEKMGVQGATEASPGVMQAGRQRLKDTYNQIAARNTIDHDPQLNQDISQIRGTVDRSLTGENARVIHNQLDDLENMFNANGGQLSGAGYEQFQSALGKVARDGGKAPFVTDIRQALTGALQRQASPGDAALLAQTNQRYAAMKAIQKAIDSNTNMVSPSQLYNALDTVKGANGTVYGQGPNQALIQLAQAGKALIGRTTANSGTTQRAAGLGLVGGLGAEAYDIASGKPMNTGDFLKGAIALGLAPEVAQRLVYSNAGRATIQRWAQSRIAAATKVAAARAGGATGGAAAQQLNQPAAAQ